MSKSKPNPLVGAYEAAREALPPLEFALRAPAGASYVFLYALAAILGTATLASVAFKVPVTMRFPGALRLEGPPTRVTSSQEKRLRRVLVREGESVEKGEVLVEVGGVLPEAQERALALFTSELSPLLADVARAGACRGECVAGLRRLAAQGVPPLSAVRPRELVANVKAALDDFLAVRVESGGAEGRRARLNERARALREKKAALARSPAGVDLRYEAERIDEELRTLEGDLAGEDAKDRAGSDRSFGRLDDEARELQRYVQGLVGERFVRSPLRGHVTRIHVGGVDEIVPAGSPLVDVAPEESYVVAELSVPTRDVAGVEEGHDLYLALDAFPSHRFGLVPARVESVPRAADATGGQGVAPVFKVVARPATQGFDQDGRVLPFRAGMTLTGVYEVRRERPLFLLFELLAGASGE